MFELLVRLAETLSALIADPSREAQDRALGILVGACAVALVIGATAGSAALVLGVLTR
jgi:hypothetical protein